MATTNVKVHRQPVVVSAESSRSLDEKLYVRFPAAARALIRIGWNLVRSQSPDSRLRRAVLSRLARRGAEAVNRGDLELFSVFVHPEIESVNTPRVVALGGLAPRSRGRDAWLAGQQRWLDDWKDLRYQPEDVLDLGDDRLLLLGRARGSGRSSGIEIDTEWALLATISGGLLIEERNFLDHAEALEAAGLGVTPQ